MAEKCSFEFVDILQKDLYRSDVNLYRKLIGRKIIIEVQKSTGKT